MPFSQPQIFIALLWSNHLSFFPLQLNCEADGLGSPATRFWRSGKCKLANRRDRRLLRKLQHIITKPPNIHRTTTELQSTLSSSNWCGRVCSDFHGNLFLKIVSQPTIKLDAMSDNSENSDNNSGLHGDDICRDFLRNVCKRGKRCKYRHPDTCEAKELGRRHEYTFCHDYQNTGCRRSTCKFIHCTREEEEYYKQTGQLPVRLQQAAALGIGAVPNELPLLKGEIPICKDFLKGDCKRGARCKFRHLSTHEYDYELRRTERRSRPLTLSDKYNYDDDFDRYTDYENIAVKRRRTDFDDYSTNGFDSQYRDIPRTTDYRLLEDENIMLRRKMEELKKQVSDLTATNEVLLEQNARYRANKLNSVQTVQTVTTAGPPIVTVSQVLTPTVTVAPAVARSATATYTLNSLGTTLPQQIAINNDLVQQHALQQRLAELATPQQQASLAQQSINTPVSINGAVPTIVPVSIAQSIVPAGSIAAQVTLSQQNIAAAPVGSMAQTIPSAINLTSMSGATPPMVSFPIVSQSVHNAALTQSSMAPWLSVDLWPLKIVS